jgi:hypothetical protein
MDHHTDQLFKGKLGARNVPLWSMRGRGAQCCSKALSGSPARE